MKLIIGLGNPDDKYKYTRHNLGARFIDFLVDKFNLNLIPVNFNLISNFYINNEKYLISKTTTYMNDSGRAVSYLKNFYKLQENDIYIVFDDLDIQEGKFKIQKGKYSKSHNGIKDIANYLNTKELNFIRIGIENRTKEIKKNIPGNTFVLSETDYDFNPIFENIIQILKIC